MENQQNQRPISQLVDTDIIQAGWLNTNEEQRYWFVLTPGHLKYYTSNNVENLAGHIIMSKKYVVRTTQFERSGGNNWHVVCLREGEAEKIKLFAVTQDEQQAWQTSLTYTIDYLKLRGITHADPLKRSSGNSKYFGHKPSTSGKQLVSSKVENQNVQKAVRFKPEVQQEPDGYKITINGTVPEENNNSLDSEKSVLMQKTVSTQEDNKSVSNSTGGQTSVQSVQDLIRGPQLPQTDKMGKDANALEEQIEKIRVVFLKIDNDGNGKIDIDEFTRFLKSMGTNLDQQAVEDIFRSVDKDNNKFLFFDEFVNYFLNCVMDESPSSLKMAFFESDKDGSGAVNLEEFTEFAKAQKVNMSMQKLISTFNKLDKGNDGEIQFDEFKHIFEKDGEDVTDGLAEKYENGTKKSQAITSDFLKDTYESANVTDLATFLKSRWDSFSDFKRYGGTGELAMEGEGDIVQDIVPGSYSLVDLACFNDLPPIEPEKVVIKNVKWISSGVSGKSGRAIFPSEFDCKVPVELATNENLAYYGCSLANGNQLKVSIVMRNAVQDFTYSSTYLHDYVTSGKESGGAGGAGIEKHGFAHLDCPLDEDSGYFVIGKHFKPDELHLTAFKVPTRHTIYVPGDVVHSNDYLTGTWRTMLSDEAEIDHVQLMKENSQEHFSFLFKEQWKYVGYEDQEK